jgi:hypothetical protein
VALTRVFRVQSNGAAWRHTRTCACGKEQCTATELLYCFDAAVLLWLYCVGYGLHLPFMCCSCIAPALYAAPALCLCCSLHASSQLEHFDANVLLLLLQYATLTCLAAAGLPSPRNARIMYCSCASLRPLALQYGTHSSQQLVLHNVLPMYCCACLAYTAVRHPHLLSGSWPAHAPQRTHQHTG